MRPHGSPSLDEGHRLAERVAAGVETARGGAFAAVLARCASDAAAYEASVRYRAGSEPRAGRMMIERAASEILMAIARALDVALPTAADRWLDLARHQGMPLIAGWDLRRGGSARCVKLYINASDASRAARTELCTALIPGARPSEPPAVIGMNARADRVTETKLYVQSADALALARDAGEPAEALATAARVEGADAGGVLSYDVADGELHARAFFVALREPPAGAEWQTVRSLPGYDRAAVESLLPFAPAPPRSVGVSLTDDSWTLYCKPRDSGRAPEAIEPAAIFRVDDAEVGVFIEPTEHAARAFRRTERHAISVRVRDGVPSRHALESLVDWFTARLRVVERAGGSIETEFGDPPAPWRVIESGSRPAAPGGRA
jgi:hypothetical protein